MDMYDQSTKAQDIETERLAMLEAMDEIAELLYDDVINKHQLADIIIPFVSNGYLANTAILAAEFKY